MADVNHYTLLTGERDGREIVRHLLALGGT